MRNLIVGALASVLVLSGCEEPVEAPVEEEKLGDYKAGGTEPFWNVEIKGEEIIFSTADGDNDFTLPVARMNTTESGWTVKGFSDEHNINIYITTGEECSDGMSDRAYADTVKVEVSKGGTLNGCGGDYEESEDDPA